MTQLTIDGIPLQITMWLLIDDQRDLNCEVIVRNPRDARLILEKCQHWECVCFDNDLGYKEEGYQILDWMIDTLQYLPPRIQLVTDNCSALQRMRLTLRVNGYHTINNRDFFLAQEEKTITRRLREIFDHHDWDRFCEVTGTNPYCFNEGLVDDSSCIDLTPTQARECGLL